MSYQVLDLDPVARAREKQASRENDAARLRRGEVSRGALRQENSFFGVLDLPNFQIAAIGRRRISA